MVLRIKRTAAKDPHHQEQEASISSSLSEDIGEGIVHLGPCELYERFPDLYREGLRFAARPPVRQLEGSPGLRFSAENTLYVRQKEDAVTYLGDLLDGDRQVRHCGTQDVLTCNVVVLHHKGSKVTAIGHYDEYVQTARLELLVSRFCETVRKRRGQIAEEEWTWGCEGEDGSSEWEWVWEDEDEEEQLLSSIPDPGDEDMVVSLSLVGGYKEESGKGLALSTRILSFFASHPLAFDLDLCCLGQVNTAGPNGNTRPRVTGVVCDVANGEVAPADFERTFIDKLPEEDLQVLMLGPSLIRKPFKLKQMILRHEDRGFSKSPRNVGPMKTTA